MKLRSLLLGLILGAVAFPASAQEIDVTSVLADTKTFIFDNGENTVKGYVYAQLEAKTNCCGDDRIYLEVKVDPSGYVLAAKSLTGDNECFRQSAVDIVKNIQWDASDFKGPKSVYFEIKPAITCTDERDNEYVALEIFNNERLNPTGSQTGAPVAANEEEEGKEADPQKIEDLINVTNGDEAAAEEDVASGLADGETKEESFDDVVSDEPNETPRPADPPATEKAEPQPAAAEPADISSGQKAAAERVAQQKEIDALRQQLKEMRKQEEQRRKELAAREEARKKREAQMKAQQEARQAQAQAQQEASSEEGGLFLSGPEEQQDDDAFAMSEDQSEEERLRQEIDRLRQQQRELEDIKRQREQEMVRVMEENRRDNQEIIRLEEEIAAKEEEAARTREEMELKRLEEERMQVAEQRRMEEENYRMMMDEIARLQAEAEAKIKELEAQKAELNKMAELRKKREQEIALERAIREKERKARLEQTRLEIMSSGTPITSVGNSDDMTDLMGIDLTAEADSETLKILIQQIQQMRGEMARLQQQIRELGGEPVTSPRASYSYASNGDAEENEGSSNGRTRSNDDSSNNGAVDTSWENIDYRDPSADPSLYPTKPKPKPQPQPTTPATGDESTAATSGDGQADGQEPAPTPVPQFDPRRGYTNNLDSEHENVSGPKSQVREYIEGRDAMKQKISGELAAADVCGLAQSLFSVTIDPQGDVVNHRILGANTDLVEIQMMTIVPTLKFQPASVRFNQTLYLEFKAEIKCDGQEKVDLKEVNPILDAQEKNN